MIKLLIFDLSGVCFSAEEQPFLEIFAKEHHLSSDVFISAYNELIVQSETDALSAEELWSQLSLKFHFSYTLSVIMQRMFALKEQHATVLSLVKQLRSSYHTAYFTNYNRAYWAVHEELFDLTPYFESGIVSYQIQSRKPEPRGFMLLLERFSVKPHEAVFIDDSQKNVSSAQKLGICGLHFHTLKQLVSDLQKVGVQIEQLKDEVNDDTQSYTV